MSLYPEKCLAENVKVIIKYLVMLRDKTGRRQDEVVFLKGTTLSNLTDWLNNRYELSLPNLEVMATLNGRGWGQLPLGLSTEIKEGDVICLFPPIFGG